MSLHTDQEAERAARELEQGKELNTASWLTQAMAQQIKDLSLDNVELKARVAQLEAENKRLRKSVRR